MKAKTVAGMLALILVSGVFFQVVRPDKASDREAVAEYPLGPDERLGRMREVEHPVDDVAATGQSSKDAVASQEASDDHSAADQGKDSLSVGDLSSRTSAFTELLSTAAINSRSPYETIDIMRAQPVDGDWAEKTKNQIVENTAVLLRESGASLSMLECFTENCMFSYVSPESPKDGPGSFIEIAQGVTALGAKVDLIADENNPYQWFLVVRFDR